MSLAIEAAGGVCRFVLDAPPGNVLDRALCTRIEQEVRERAADPHLKAFVFTASGKHFSYGASIPEHRRDEVGGFLPRFHAMFLALAESGVPAIAGVPGLCLGGGLELAAYCHFVLADETAAFAVPEVTLAVFPPAACVFLPWKVGGAVAEDLILTGRKMGAVEAEHRGLVNRVCSEGGLEDAIEALIDRKIRPRSAVALRHTARAVREPLTRDLAARFEALERSYLGELMATEDANEGIESFLEKRKPIWKDR